MKIPGRKRDLVVVLAVSAAGVLLFALRYWQPVDACVTGDARARALAEVPDALRARYLDAGTLRVGLGSAAIGGWGSLGDALVVGGRAWLRTTHKSSPRYYRVVANRYFQSNYFVSVPAGREPAENLAISAGTSLHTLGERLARHYPAGVIAAGYARFETLASIAIAEPAVNDAPIAQHAARYYTRPMETARDTWAYVVILAASSTGLFGTADSRLLSAGEMKTRHVQLVHALRLYAAPTDARDPPQASQVSSLGQLLATSMLAEGELALFPVGRAGDCLSGN
jgi:hypothetical protein